MTRRHRGHFNPKSLWTERTLGGRERREGKRREGKGGERRREEGREGRVAGDGVREGMV